MHADAHCGVERLRCMRMRQTSPLDTWVPKQKSHPDPFLSESGVLIRSFPSKSSGRKSRFEKAAAGKGLLRPTKRPNYSGLIEREDLTTARAAISCQPFRSGIVSLKGSHLFPLVGAPTCLLSVSCPLEGSTERLNRRISCRCLEKQCCTGIPSCLLC